MNILFMTQLEPCPTRGGIERITAVLAEGLKQKYGHNCFNIYWDSAPDIQVPRYEFAASFQVSKSNYEDEIADILRSNHIDIIINQMITASNIVIRKAVDKANIKCGLIFALHDTPQFFYKSSFRGTKRAVLHPVSFLSFCKRSLMFFTLPVFRFYERYRYKKTYIDYLRQAYSASDVCVLHSKNYYDDWEDVTKQKESSKLFAIPNSQSYVKSASPSIVYAKEKRVLLVSRMAEFQKQILMAIKIWSDIAGDPMLNDWRFDIVGEGEELERYKRYVVRHKIPRVIFHGRQKPRPYYERASIFLMTSRYEGWGLTLTEAQQMGAVPVAFSSYNCIYDIITDGENGFLVKPFNKKEYIKKVKLLMTDSALREKMGQNAIISTERYTLDKVIDQWQDLFNEIKLNSVKMGGGKIC